MKIKLKTRRVFKCGKYSMFLTLPSEWINHHQINSGDYLTLEIVEDGSLSLLPNKNYKPEVYHY